MLEEVGSIAGVTSLSPATVAVHAPQEGSSTDYTALANATSALIVCLKLYLRSRLPGCFDRLSRPPPPRV